LYINLSYRGEKEGIENFVFNVGQKFIKMDQVLLNILKIIGVALVVFLALAFMVVIVRIIWIELFD
jgi:hypothetical protein